MFALSDVVGTFWFGQKIAAVLLGVLGTLALLLAALGLFSVMAYTVSQRTKEIGLLCVVALAASLVPARQAALVDPLVALRAE